MFATICALGVPTWWLALFWSPMVRGWFVPSHEWVRFQSLLWPDQVLTVSTGILAVRLLRGDASSTLATFVAGAWAYATAYTMAWAAAVSAPVLGPSLMVVALAGFGVVWYELVSPR